MKTTKILQLWISMTVILGCSTGPTLASESIALQEVKIGYTSTSISVFPIEFARRKGFLRDEGLNIVMIVMRTNVIMNACSRAESIMARLRPLSSGQPPATCR